MQDLAAQAARFGIEPEYVDARGLRRVVAQETLQRLLAAVGSAGADAAHHTPALVWRQGRSGVDNLPPAVRTATWRILADDGRELARGGYGLLEFLNTAPLGTYRLLIDSTPPQDLPAIVAPATAYQLEDVAAERIWALAVQLYAVRSRRNWGHGDFTDLLQLVRLAPEIGAAGIGLNPLHALFMEWPEQASPYSPNSRLFLNPLYIDAEAVPGFPGLRASGLEQEIERLRAAELVDYAGVAAAKERAFRLAYSGFRAARNPAWEEEFDKFRAARGSALIRFAAFETLRRRFQRVWWEWPEEWRKPNDSKLAALRAEAAEEIGYHEFLQWIADRQLAACQAEGRRLQLPVGLYIDLAVGVEPGGADAWSDQDAILPQVEVGAPPDLLNTAGQAWGLAAFNPRALEAQAFAPFTKLLEAAMRHAGAIRLDHVLGLNRLYLIPLGLKPQDGAYMRYPLQALLAAIALESRRHKCLVIGEDLGTVPEELRGILADWGIWSYLVLLFERKEDGTFKLPHEYRRNALVTFSTHDLPTFAGWRSGHDMRIKWALGLDPGETDAERAQAQELLSEALRRAGLAHGEQLEFEDVLRFLARTPSRLLVVEIDDVLGLEDQPNVPGTVTEHPNWRRRLPVNIEDLHTHDSLRRIATALAEEKRSYTG